MSRQQKSAKSGVAAGKQPKGVHSGTFGFSDKADLDEGAMWPTDFALKELTPTSRRGSARW